MSRKIKKIHFKTRDGLRCRPGVEIKLSWSEDLDHVDCNVCLGLVSGDRQAHFRSALDKNTAWKKVFKKQNYGIEI